MNVISGDMFSTSTSTRTYLGSFRSNACKKQTNENTIELNSADVEFTSGFEHFENIRVAPLESKSHDVSVQLKEKSGKVLNCTCERKSEFFRSVLIEHDYEEEVAPLLPLDSKDLSSGLQRRQPLTVSSAFAEAGIEVIVEEKKTPIPHPTGVQGAENVWTDQELHKAMQTHFKHVTEGPHWKLWMLSANEYVICTVKGIMVLHQGRTRQGCAVFQSATGWQTPEDKRLRLFIYMHELGHCFNLKHPWDSQPANPSEKSGFSTLSWMNYPWRYRLSEKVYGSEDFWKAFNFEFSDSELMHLRHGFRNDVIFGANSLGTKE